MINNAKKHLDYYFAIRYHGPNRGRNGHEEELTFLIVRGGRTAGGLRVRRFFASAPTDLAEHFGGLHGGSSGPPDHVPGNVNPCGPPLFGASYRTAS